MIPYGRQEVSEADIEAVVQVLRSDFLTQGPMIPLFERAIADYCGVSHAVSVSSATAGLHIACLSLGLGPGDWLWTTPISFVASANCALYCGASVDFVDIELATFNLSVSELEKKLITAESVGRLPKVVVVVHMAGEPCDMQAIFQLGRKYGFYIIEDASHAIGGRIGGDPIGCCRFSDVTVFSFHPVKIITTAEGGCAVTNRAELAEKMARLRTHGITRDPEQMTRSPEGAWYYQQIELGYNYRLTDIQAALGLSQFQRLDHFVERRHAIAAKYDEMLVNLPVTSQLRDTANYSGLHLYVVRMHLQEIRASHQEVFDSLREAGVGVNVHYIPIHLQPYFERMGFKAGDFPAAEQYYRQALSLPLFPALTAREQSFVVKVLSDALSR